MTVLAPLPVQKFFDSNGRPLVSGLLFTYASGTTAKIATWQDSAGATPNANPIVLDYRGEARVWLDPALTYKFVLSPANDTDPPTAPIWTVDNLAGGVTISTLTQQFLGQIIYPRTPAEITATVMPAAYIYPELNILRYGADPSGVTNNDTAWAALVSVVNAKGGGAGRAPAGSYKHAADLPLPRKFILQGDGKTVTQFISSHVGNGFISTAPINSSTAVNIGLRDIGLSNSNAANTGGGYVDVGGTFLNLENVRVNGFKYNVILDQSELVDLEYCDFEFCLTGAVWLVNGADHTAGANPGFTNRIGVRGCQFNNNVGQGIAIIDDGGLAHSFEDNDYSGFLNQGRFANATALKIDGGEFEASSGPPLVFATTTSVLGTAVTKSFGVTIQSATFGPALGQFAISIGANALGQTVLLENYFATTSASAISGVSQCSNFTALGNALATAPLHDGLSPSHFQTDLGSGFISNQPALLSGTLRSQGQFTGTGPGGSSISFDFLFPYVAGRVFDITRGAYDAAGTSYSHRASRWIETASGTFLEGTQFLNLQGGTATVTTDTVTRSGNSVRVTVFIAKAATVFTNYANTINVN